MAQRSSLMGAASRLELLNIQPVQGGGYGGRGTVGLQEKEQELLNTKCTLHIMPQDGDQEVDPYLSCTLRDLCLVDQAWAIGCYYRDHKVKKDVRGLAEDWELSAARVNLHFCPWDNTIVCYYQ